MKNFKEMKYLLLDLDGVCYGKHNNYSLEKVFGQVSQRMTMFISERLKIDMEEAKKLQTELGRRRRRDVTPQRHRRCGCESLRVSMCRDAVVRRRSSRWRTSYCTPRGARASACSSWRRSTSACPSLPLAEVR